MKYEDHLKLEEAEAAKGRRELATVYFFLIISALMYGAFFFHTRELTLIGCAFLCNAASLVYLIRSIGRACPFRQATLARRCASEPSDEAVLRLCAALEISGPRHRYGSGPREAFAEAYSAYARQDGPELARLCNALREYAGMDTGE